MIQQLQQKLFTQNHGTSIMNKRDLFLHTCIHRIYITGAARASKQF